MGITTGISWTGTRQADGTMVPGSTFNPWIGCVHYGPGCDFCYAEAWDNRNLHGPESHWGPGSPRKEMSEHYWNGPLRWDRTAKATGVKHKVFCASLADVFEKHPALDERRARLWPLIKQTTSLTWLVLTKRAENINDMLPADWGDGYDNVWLGVTTENQACADFRIGKLRQVKAKTKFLSVEPQLEKIDFSHWMGSLCSRAKPFDWLIFGGESGTDEKKDKDGNIINTATCRPFDPEWMREPMEQAKESGIAVFVKQMGTIYANAHRDTIKEKKGGDPSEWPEWMQKQEFPK